MVTPSTSYAKEEKVEKLDLVQEVTYIPNKERTCLTKDKATQIYEEIEKNEPITIQIVSQRTFNTS